MKYSIDDLFDLIKFLGTFDPKYEFVQIFFKSNMFRLTEGLSEPGNIGSAYVIEQMKELFPDVYFALKIPNKDLPLYLNPMIGLEYPIAVWRLQLKRDRSNSLLW